MFLGNRERDALHPSRQVGNYERYMKDVHTTFSEGRLGLAACGYMHNMRDTDSLLFDSIFRPLLAQYPLFTGGEVDEFANFLTGRLVGGDGVSLLEEVLKGRYRPHKRLLSHVSKMIANEPTYVLLDEQQVVMNHILGRVRVRHASIDQSVFLIRGGPGTGKSVDRGQPSGRTSRRRFRFVEHATGSKAFTENLRKTVGSRASALFGYFNSFAKADEDSIDVFICDEAHRPRQSSNSRFTKRKNSLRVAAGRGTPEGSEDHRVLHRRPAGGPTRRGWQCPADPGNNRSTGCPIVRARVGSTVPVRRLRGLRGMGREHAGADAYALHIVGPDGGVRFRRRGLAR